MLNVNEVFDVEQTAREIHAKEAMAVGREERIRGRARVEGLIRSVIGLFADEPVGLGLYVLATAHERVLQVLMKVASRPPAPDEDDEAEHE